MSIFPGYQSIAKPLTKSVVTIGNFDGVHFGHRALIDRALSEAQTLNALSVAMTFRPHPQAALHPDKKIPLLLTYDEKIERLQSMGLNVIVEQPFSREFSQLTPEHFLAEVILKRLQAQMLIVGYDFRFGNGRSGSLDTLKSLAESHRIALVVVPPQKLDGVTASSSQIRAALLSHQIRFATRLLGYPFFYQGIVTRGDGRGRTIGIPTANIGIHEKLALPHGVYATRSTAWAPNGSAQTVKSVTNVGVRPTFAQADSPAETWVETHLMGFSGDLYGSRLKVEFLDFIRPEQKFDGVAPLVERIRKDIEKAREINDNFS